MRQARSVLVVEDEPMIAMLAQDTLEAAGFVVAVATDAGAALALLARADYGAAVVDLGLPDRHGSAVLERLRATAPGTGVVVSTGYHPALGGLAERPPGAALLPKPWDPTDLVAAVAAAAGVRPAARVVAAPAA